MKKLILILLILFSNVGIPNTIEKRLFSKRFKIGFSLSLFKSWS